MNRHCSEVLLNDGRILGVQWEASAYRNQPMEIFVDGEPLAVIPDRKALLAGWEHRFDDGSLLRFEIKRGALYIAHDGRLLREKGMQSQEQTDAEAVKIAGGVLYFIGALTFALGLGSMALGMLKSMNVNAAYSMALGALFLVLGHFVNRKLAPALLAAIALYCLDALVLLINLLQGAYMAVGAIAFHACLLVPLIKGYGAIRRLLGNTSKA